MNKNPTMQEIANELKLSRLTVSSVINGNASKRGISAKTITVVEDYLNKRGYVPSMQARNLRLGERSTLGILYTGHLYSHLTEAFNRVISIQNANKESVEIMIVQQIDLLKGIQELRGRGVTRLIWIQTERPENLFKDIDKVLNFLAPLDSVIFYNYQFGDNQWVELFQNEKIHLVGIDRLDGFKNMGRFLKKIGHEKVGITGSANDGLGEIVKNAYTSIGLEPKFTNTKTKADTLDLTGKKIAKDILTLIKNEGVTAASFVDDEVAGHAMVELMKCGIKVPEELTITGYDGMSYASALRVPLTTLSIPVEDMVDHVFKLLNQKRIKKNNYSHVFKTKVIKRESHSKPNK
ncbi:MAG: hypothetical protein COA79_17740 [Planctomycetota bacterium]|nr:MAG: hypothetical protein COA79_17740 [Planctomycetota bacterium]